ncbi:pancreatic secretory granule membrane major glycoprotein GP2-like [Spea bombifrons]|uniref:pancreatic secretory granule membrane major glycoprotein GP2-like n=1 Tax=Spea bombifrons TaxID=233779 RepID=UPI00234AD468|nr:pancreatic secretory granule membrane major glycoprotein GP2-like [Spea bombifrons]
MQQSLKCWLPVLVLASLLPPVTCGSSNPLTDHEENVQRFYYDPWLTTADAKGVESVLAEACTADACRNGGICRVVQGKAKCHCGPGFTGPRCQEMSFHLDCEDHMQLWILKSSLHYIGVNVSLLHLLNPRCKVEETSELYASATLTHANQTFCGTRVHVNGSHLVYSNEIRTATGLVNMQPITGGAISRSPDISIKFACVYPYNRVVSLPFPLLTSASLVTFIVKEGEFNVTMTLYPSPEFSEPYDWAPTIPVSHKLYVQLQIHGHGVQKPFTLELEECWATPGANHSDATHHPIISNGSGTDVTAERMTSKDNTLTRFSLQMFYFVSYPEVYLHCRVRLCQANGTSCVKPTASTERKRRDLIDPYRKVVSCGPIRLARRKVAGVGKLDSDVSPLVLPGALAAGAMLLLLCLVAVAKALKRRGLRP